MVTTVYIDVLYIENLLIDLFILYLTGFIMNTKFRFFRSFLASAIGSFYMCSLYFSDFGIYESFGFKLIVMAAMLFIAFRIKEIFDFLKYIMAFLFMNIALGGCIYFFNNVFSAGSIKNGVYYVKTRFFGVIAGISLLIFLGRFFVVLMKKSITEKKIRQELTLIYMNKKIKLNTLLDTGNSLIDPISHASVVVVSNKKVKNLITEKNISSIKNFRLIPCKTVTNKYELLYGFKPDKFFYKQKEINAVVAISESEFDGDYDAIINPLTLI